MGGIFISVGIVKMYYLNNYVYLILKLIYIYLVKDNNYMFFFIFIYSFYEYNYGRYFEIIGVFFIDGES